MLKTGILLDFITVDGMEAGTAAGSAGALGFTGTPLNDAVLFVHNVLVGANLRKHIKVIASGKVLTERDIIAKVVRGADICATARGMMISVGCDQQRECYKGTCQRGIATQDPQLLKHFDVLSSTEKIANYHRITIEELAELVSIAGATHPAQLPPFCLQKRVSPFEVKALDEIYPFIQAGGLLSILPWAVPADYRKSWQRAKHDAPFAALAGAV